MNGLYNSLIEQRLLRDIDNVSRAALELQSRLEELIEKDNVSEHENEKPGRKVDIVTAYVTIKKASAELLQLRVRVSKASAKERQDMVRGATMDDKYTKRASELQAVRDNLSGPLSQRLGAALEQVQGYQPHGLADSLESALRSLKTAPMEHLDYNQLTEEQDASVLRQIYVLAIIFYDPPSRVVHKAWEGLRAAIGPFTAVAFNVSLLCYFLDIGRPAMQSILMMVLVQKFYQIRCHQFFIDIAASIILDEPHPRDPVGIIEDIIGGFLKMVVYAVVSSFTLGICVWKYGKPLAFLKEVLFWNIVLLGCVVAMMSIVVIPPVVIRLGRHVPQSSFGPHVRQTCRTLWYIISRIILLCIQWAQAVALSIRWSVLESVQLCKSFSGDSALPVFCYRKLDVEKREIRLLKVYKKTPFSSPTFSLVNFTLEEAPPYDAISYTWGGQNRDIEMCLHNGKRNGKLKITKNVERIVHNRATFKRTNWLWIDSISINQDDLEEKPGQLRLMTDIYRSASRVLAWLDYEDIPILDLTLMHILNRHLWKGGNLLPLCGGFSDSISAKVLQRMWQARTRLICQRYWTRCWIVQELAVAKKIYVVYGGQMLIWETLEPRISSPHVDTTDQLYRTMETLMEHATIADIETKRGRNSTQLALTKEARPRMVSLYGLREIIQEKRLIDLAVLLAMTSEFESTEACDRIISLLGMAEDYPEELRRNLNFATKDIFVKVSQHLIQTDVDFVMKCGGIGYVRNIDTLPSWTPDWSALSTHRQGPSFSIEALARLLSGVRSAIGPNYYCGSPKGSSSTKPQVQVAGTSLIMMGVRVSQTVQLSPPFAAPLPAQVFDMASFLSRETELSNIFTAEEMLKHFPTHYAHATGQSAVEAFWRTLIGDLWMNADPVQQSSANILSPAPADAEYCFKSFKGLIKDIVALREKLTDSWEDYYKRPFDRMAMNIPDLQTLRSFGTLDLSAAFKFIGSLAIWGKRVARTADGHLCLVPDMSREGDEIFAIAGLQQPLVLRRVTETEDKWHLVGACYVHGIMRGEIWTSRSTTGKLDYLNVE